MSNPDTQPVEYIVFVHGTYAANENDAVDAACDRWWQRDSEFAQTLAARLSAADPETRYKIAPAIDFRDDYRPWWAMWCRCLQRPSAAGVFHWSGANSEASRRQAGVRLFDYLQQIEKQANGENAGEPLHAYHVVAHSHGGAVLWEALNQATRQKQSLKHLGSWTTVGTPFLTFRPDWWGYLLLPLVLLALLSLVLWQQWSWWSDFWRQAAPVVAQAPLLIAATYLLNIAGVVTLASLLLRLAWSYYCFTLTDRESSPARWELELWDLLSSAVALVVMALLVAAYDVVLELSVPGLLSDLWHAQAAWDWSAVLGVTWTLGALGLLAFALFRIIACLLQWKRSADRATFGRQTLETFGARHFPAGWSASGLDEAINGLRVLRRPIAGPLLPRFESPRAARYTPQRSLPRRPENEQLRQQTVAWLLQFLLLPLALVWHWILQPFYNEVIARLLDDFVLDRLRRSAIGQDIPALVLDDVSILPGEQRRPVPRSASKGDTVFEGLRADVDKPAAAFLDHVRSLFAQEWIGGASFERFFQRAMQGRENVTHVAPGAEELVGSSAMDVLVHTSYFTQTAIVQQILKRIGGAPEKINLTEQQPAPMQTRHGGSPALGQMLWWLTRRLAWWAIILLPVALLFLAGRWWAYPYSNVYGARQALELIPAGTNVKTSIVGIADATAEKMLDDDTQSRKRLALTGYCAAARLFSPKFDVSERIAGLAGDGSVGFMFRGDLACRLVETRQPDAACQAFASCIGCPVDAVYFDWLGIKLSSALARGELTPAQRARLSALIVLVADKARQQPLSDMDRQRVHRLMIRPAITDADYEPFLQAAALATSDPKVAVREVGAIKLRRVLESVGHDERKISRLQGSPSIGAFNVSPPTSEALNTATVAFLTQVSRLQRTVGGNPRRAFELLDSLSRLIASASDDENYDRQMTLLTLGYLEIGCVDLAQQHFRNIQQMRHRLLASQGFLIAELKRSGMSAEVFDAVDPFWNLLKDSLQGLNELPFPTPNHSQTR